jgi:hypothetical protein
VANKTIKNLTKYDISIVDNDQFSLAATTVPPIWLKYLEEEESHGQEDDNVIIGGHGAY